MYPTVNRFYMHHHKPTNTVKFGITTNTLEKRLSYEAAYWNRKIEDYEIILDIETLNCWVIEDLCIQLLAKHFKNKKVGDIDGKKRYQERFHYNRAIIKQIKRIADKNI